MLTWLVQDLTKYEGTEIPPDTLKYAIIGDTAIVLAFLFCLTAYLGWAPRC